MRRRLLFEDVAAEWGGDQTPGSVFINFKDYMAHHQNELDWKIYGFIKDGHNEYELFSLKHELEFQWNGNQQQQAAVAKRSDEGMTVRQLVNDVDAIFEHEFTGDHGVEGDNNQRLEAFRARFNIKLSDEAGHSCSTLAVVRSPDLKAYFLTDNAYLTGADVELNGPNGLARYLQNINANNTAQPTTEFLTAYITSICTGTRDPMIADNTVLDDLRENCTIDPYVGWWKQIMMMLAFLPVNDRNAIFHTMSSHGFTIEDNNVMPVVTSWRNPHLNQQNNEQPAAQQQQPQQNAQHVQQNGQPAQANAQQVNATIQADPPFNGHNADWFSSHNVYVVGKMEPEQFEQWWAAQRQELKSAIIGTKTRIRYMKFLGTPDESDSTVKRTQLVIWDKQVRDLKIYGQMTLPRKQRPIFNVLYAFRCNDIRVFNPFCNKRDGDWHGHLYSLRNDHINNGRHGMRILYDPDGYLNALYAAHPTGVTLHGDGPGVPQTIGNAVTPQSDLTAGIPRTQLQPLTAEQQAAIDAQTQAIAQANATRQAQEEARLQRVQQHENQMKQEASNLRRSMDQVFNRPEFRNIIHFWPGAQAQADGVARPNFSLNIPLDHEYLIINFPGTSEREIIGEQRVREYAGKLGLDNMFDPIIEALHASHPNAEVVLKFNGSISA